MASQTASSNAAKKAFQPKPPVSLSDLQPMYTCKLIKDLKSGFTKLRGFPSLSIEGTLAVIWRNEETRKEALGIKLSEEDCQALKTALENAVEPHLLTNPIAKKRKISYDIKSPLKPIDHDLFDSPRDFWGIEVTVNAKTTYYQVEDGKAVLKDLAALSKGNEVQIQAFVSVWDYTKNGEPKKGISIVASSILFEEGKQEEEEENIGEDGEIVPPTPTLTWKGKAIQF
jgi:hypothetical protein